MPGHAAPLKIGRYVLHREIASGGMASVHFGTLIAPGGFTKTVAIKRLHRAFARHVSLKASILEEARLASRIRHPNVVPPLDIVSEKGELLLVMEYVHGESLSKLMRSSRNAAESVPIPIGAAIMTNVLHGLHAAHDARDERGQPLDIVHRDVSPQNVLVGLDGVARVIDFGIAKAATSSEKTTAGTIKGKVPYLAPEQLEGEVATRRTDIYAASVVFWEVLAGKRLFDASEDPEILRQILLMEVPPPSAYNRSVPPAVDAIVLRGIARAPQDRFATAREMALELEREIHLATPTQVGAWMEPLAADALALRATILSEVETAERYVTTRPPPPPAADLSLDEPMSGVGTVGGFRVADMIVVPQTPALSYEPLQVSTRPPSRAPELNLDESMSGVGTVGGFRAEDVMVVPAPSAPAYESLQVEPLKPPPSRFPVAGELRKPQPEIANVQWLPRPTKTVDQPAGTSWGMRLFGITGLVVVLLGALLWVFLPELVQKRLVSDMALAGVTFSVERVDLSMKAVHLVRVKATAADIPKLTVTADAVDLDIRALTPIGITIQHLKVTAVGKLGDVLARVDRFRAGKGKGLDDLFRSIQKVELVSGKIEWKEVFGPTSSLTVENVHYEGTVDDGRFSVPILSVRAGDGLAGPWAMEIERNVVYSRAVLKLDPTGTYQTTVTFTLHRDGGGEVVFGIPPTALSDLHLPPAMLGSMATERTRIGLTGSLVVASVQGPPPPAASGRLVLTGSNLAALANAPPLAAAFDIEVNGEAGKTVPIRNATFTLTATDTGGRKPVPIATAKVAGSIDMTEKKTAFELVGKATSLPCTTRGDVSLWIHLSVTLDKLVEGKLSFEPSSVCVLRVR